jgi:Selenoprotein, putative
METQRLPGLKPLFRGRLMSQRKLRPLKFAAFVTRFWQGLREWSGDAAYETYAKCAARDRAARVLSREEFYVEQLQRKYSRVSRCC